MRIGILTHFASFQPSYALHVGWHERAKLLEYFDQDFDFLVDNNVPDGLFPHQKSILPRIKTGKPYVERVKFFTNAYKELLQPYDAILTADLVYQRKANFLAYNQALRYAAKELKAKWYHWIHSSWTYRPTPLPPYPDSLRYIMPEGDHTIIYLNSYELNEVAKMFDTNGSKVYCVYNPKDPRTFFDLSPLACTIVKQLKLWEKDVFQIFPHSSERMDAKGIDAVIKSFAALKRLGLKVALLFANANSRSVQPEIARKKKVMAEVYNLIDGEDYIFTSDWTEKLKPLPRKDVADFFRLANVFVFGSWRETVGNCYQEAKAAGNLLVLNNNLPACKETAGDDAIFFQTDFKTPGIRDGQTGDFKKVNYPDEFEYFDALAALIAERLFHMPKLTDRWTFSYEWIWKNQFKPLLYGHKS